MRHPTMEDVAREAEVSRALVSLVFRGSPKVAEQSRARVLAAAEHLGYRPNAMARGLASRARNTVGVLVNDLHNPFFAEIIDGIEELADAEELRLLLAHGGHQPRERFVVDALLEYRPAGLLLLSPEGRSGDLAEQAGGVPVVVVGRPVRQTGMDTVVDDDVLGAGLAVDHLVALGHRRITHVSGGRREAGAKQRVRGYREAMRSHGLAAHAQVVSGGFTEQHGIDAAERLLEAHDLPTAIFAANDLIAVGVLGVFDAHGIGVPKDVSLVGYDNSALARMRHINLTTINQPRHDMGRLALTTLLERIRDGRTRAVTHRVKPTLVVRSSTAPPVD
jgi:DNA-binding LacI/PurR family transcriptional regulator